MCQAGVSGRGDHGVEEREPLTLPATACWHRSAEPGMPLLGDLLTLVCPRQMASPLI